MGWADISERKLVRLHEHGSTWCAGVCLLARRRRDAEGYLAAGGATCGQETGSFSQEEALVGI